MLNLENVFSKYKLLNKNTSKFNNAVSKDDNVKTCPTCGGYGEIHNTNHYHYDFDYEDKYVICPRCFGKGYISQNNN